MASSATYSAFGSSLSPAAAPRTRQRTALITSSDSSFRRRLGQTLSGLRWQVREAETGAQAWTEADAAAPEAVIVDSWLPDLDLGEFVREFHSSFPGIDVVTSEGAFHSEGPRSPYRQEILYALRAIQDCAIQDESMSTDCDARSLPEQRTDTAAWNAAPELADFASPKTVAVSVSGQWTGSSKDTAAVVARETAGSDRLPELIGSAPRMLDVSRRIRLVAPRSTPVLIEGPTGSGKELVAQALHRLSVRSRKPFVALNCAAIPEALLEAELFGHTRGAFTGATQSRTGRIEAADGGTLFLDEIGEMPLALQSKLLRFVECGELQRVGDNETIRVDVRIVAATHRPLQKNSADGAFRSDLYYRLAVFLIRTPALAEHAEDLPLLVEHFLEKMGRNEPVKRVDQSALAALAGHGWPGNVRELEHVLERAQILAGDSPVITAADIDFGV